MILGRGYHSMTLMGGTNQKKKKLSSNRSSAFLLLTRRCLMFPFTLLTSFDGKTTTTTTDGTVFTLGGSFSGGIGNKHGEIWRPETETWTYLPDVKSEGTLIADDLYGVQSGEYVLSPPKFVAYAFVVFVVPSMAQTNLDP
jgi:hypothetical protein